MDWTIIKQLDFEVGLVIGRLGCCNIGETPLSLGKYSQIDETLNVLTMFQSPGMSMTYAL